VQINGCWALGNLAQDDPTTQAAIREAGGISSITAAMAVLPTDSGVQSRCQAALDNLPEDSDQCRGVACVHGRCCLGECECDTGWGGVTCAEDGGLPVARLLRIATLLLAIWLACHHHRRRRRTNPATTQAKDIEEAPQLLAKLVPRDNASVHVDTCPVSTGAAETRKPAGGGEKEQDNR
jgi:hypothetical protein